MISDVLSMLVSLGPTHPAEGPARIEVIPLIDSMSFLLAAFMLAGPPMVQLSLAPVAGRRLPFRNRAR